MSSPYRKPSDDDLHVSRNYLIQSETAERVLKAQPVVYVVQEDARKNVTGALEFGSVEGLLTLDDELTMLNVPRIVAKLQYGLRHMRPIDYILPIGNPVAIGLAFAIAAEVTGGQFKALKWDPQERRYFSAHINLHPEV